MKSAPTAKLLCALTACLWLCGCASIVSGRHAEVTIDSFPSNAHVVVRDKRGKEVAQLNTPATVALKRKDKLVFPAQYTATIEATGYQSVDVPIRSTLNPWVLGNVVVGGIPGLVIDNVTGAAWKPRQSKIHQQLDRIYPVPEGSTVAAGPRDEGLENGPEFGVQQPSGLAE